MNLAEYLLDPDRQRRERAAVAEDVERLWQLARAARDACEAGDCAYAKAGCQPLTLRSPHPRCFGTHRHRCDGYVGVKHLEHGAPVFRSARCPRYLSWHRAQAIKEKAERAGKPAPRSWGE